MAVAGSACPQIGDISPEADIVACMTIDWTEANDSISSATNAAIIEAVPDRIRTIKALHRGVSVWRHSKKGKVQPQAYCSKNPRAYWRCGLRQITHKFYVN
jgi:hypothetical protein